MEKEREQFVYQARLAEKVERYDDLVETMKKVAKLDVEFTVEERSLLFLGYKTVIGKRRSAWRIISSYEQQEEASGNEENIRRIKEYRHRVEDELTEISNDIISIIDKHLIPSSSTVEPNIFYYKMKADYYRYQAEFKVGDDRKEAADQSLEAYEVATASACANLSPAHPTRLGLTLNLSVFYYEIMKSPSRACDLAKKAFEESMAELDNLSEEDYKDSTVVMQVIKDNLSLWTADLLEEEGGSSKKK